MKVGEMQWKFGRAVTPECEYTAMLFHELAVLGVEAHLEYRFGHSRFDLVIVKDGAIVALVEMKREPTPPARWKDQKLKYLWLDIPLILVEGRNYIQRAAKIICNFYRGRIELMPITIISRFNSSGVPTPPAIVAAPISFGLGEQRNDQTEIV